MPNEHDRNGPSSDAKGHPLSQSPVTPAAPHQNKLGEEPENAPKNKEAETVRKLEEDIRTGERWLIKIGAAGVIMNVIIALIYFGQLKEMRKATRASEKAATAAASAADTADKTLKEIRAGSTDTHDLAVAAKQQAKATEATANAAYRSINVAIESDRPWIASNGISVKGATLEEIRITANYLNAGRSPARIIDATFGNEVYATFPEKPVYPPLKTHASHLLLYPGRDVSSAEIVPTLTPEDIRQIKAGSKTLYFFGFVKYEDIRTHKVHTTKFCWFYYTQDMVSVCEGHNEAD